ncbi:hypothetical protein HDV00_010725 [Rhizophlyctis rosea]|nr:hypothetical protein HDV00_010725 [Rhizophlyctis rosea]
MHLSKTLAWLATAVLAQQLAVAAPVQDEPIVLANGTVLVTDTDGGIPNPTIPKGRTADFRARSLKLDLVYRNRSSHFPRHLRDPRKTFKTPFNRRQLANPDATPDYTLINWQVNVTIGTGTSAKKPFRLIPNTGSPYTWLSKAGCSTYKSLGGSSANITYSLGTGFHAAYIQDSFTLTNSLKIPDVYFLLADWVDPTLQHVQQAFGWDGALGLAPTRQLTFLGRLADSSIISQAVFSLWFSHYNITNLNAGVKVKGNPQTTGELTFGGWSQSACLGQLAWLIPTQEPIPGNFRFDMQGFRTGPSSSQLVYSVKAGDKVNIDSGSNGLFIPSYIYNQIWPKILAAGSTTTTDLGETLIACSLADKLPMLTFWFNGYRFLIEPKDYLFPWDNTKCWIMIAPYTDGYWLLGEPFTRKYFTVWDADNKVVGFAPSNQSFKIGSTTTAAPSTKCGLGNNWQFCPATQCCSTTGWCGTTTDHCAVGKCQHGFGRCTDNTDKDPTPIGTSYAACGSTNGGAVCTPGQCCSQWENNRITSVITSHIALQYGYCGTTSDYCKYCLNE